MLIDMESLFMENLPFRHVFHKDFRHCINVCF